MLQNQTRISLEPHNGIGDHVPLNDATVTPNVNYIAVEGEGPANGMLIVVLLDHLNCITNHRKQLHQKKTNKHMESSNTRMMSFQSLVTILLPLTAM